MTSGNQVVVRTTGKLDYKTNEVTGKKESLNGGPSSAAKNMFQIIESVTSGRKTGPTSGKWGGETKEPPTSRTVTK